MYLARGKVENRRRKEYRLEWKETQTNGIVPTGLFALYVVREQRMMGNIIAYCKDGPGNRLESHIQNIEIISTDFRVTHLG